MASDLQGLRRVSRLAIYVAIGAAVAGLERLVPTPLPWIRLGLANGVALIALYSMGFQAALIVNITRALLVGLLFGTWATPALLLSLGGGIAAVIVMEIVRRMGQSRIGPVGVSVSGAFAHMLVQFILASLLLVRHGSLMVLAGPSLIAAVISGVLVGVVVVVAVDRIPPHLLSGKRSLSVSGE